MVILGSHGLMKRNTNVIFQVSALDKEGVESTDSRTVCLWEAHARGGTFGA